MLAEDATVLAEDATVAVITIVRGRHEHLRRQREGLRRSSRPVDLHVIVAMDDPDVAGAIGDDGPPSVVIPLVTAGPRLPLAEARNLGARHARSAGADVLIFLDVDCIPGDQLVERYASCAVGDRDALFSGPVAYLPPAPAAGYDLDTLAGIASGHPSRPAPEPGTLVDADHRLFWSLSFATQSRVWQRLGGFCELYTGYGGEDTDFAQVAEQAGVAHTWVGGAWAYHQYHPTQEPPVQHLPDIIRNANVFHDRWHWWPMPGWLAEFERLGLAHHDQADDIWVCTEDAVRTDDAVIGSETG